VCSYPDKRPTQRVGIVPDQEVKPTVGRCPGRKDEVLEVALRKILAQTFPLRDRKASEAREGTKTLPMSVLVAVLVTFGVLTKHNEVTAFKASGVSLYRLTAPVLLASAILSAGLFVFDYFTCRRQPQARCPRDKIKGRAIQDLPPPGAQVDQGGRLAIYYYKYSTPPKPSCSASVCTKWIRRRSELKREITAERAQWHPSLRKWIFQNGWRRDILGSTPRKRPAFRGHDVSRAGRSSPTIF